MALSNRAKRMQLSQKHRGAATAAASWRQLITTLPQTSALSTGEDTKSLFNVCLSATQ